MTIPAKIVILTGWWLSLIFFRGVETTTNQMPLKFPLDPIKPPWKIPAKTTSKNAIYPSKMVNFSDLEVGNDLDFADVFIELDDGKIYRKALYLMVKTMVSCRFSLKPIQWCLLHWGGKDLEVFAAQRRLRWESLEGAVGSSSVVKLSGGKCSKEWHLEYGVIMCV